MSHTPLRVESPSAEQQRLWRLLGLLLGGAGEARLIADEALRSAGLRELPSGRDELLELISVHLAPLLREALGHRVTDALIADLDEAMRAPHGDGVSSEPPERISQVQPVAAAIALAAMPISQVGGGLEERPRSTPRPHRHIRAIAAILEPNAFVRASLSRALVRAGFDVSSMDDPAALRSTRNYAVIVVGMSSPQLRAIFSAIVEHQSEAHVVACCADPEAAAALLDEAGIERYCVVARSASVPQVVAAAMNALVESLDG